MKKFFTEGKSQLAALTAFFTSGALMATWVARIPLIQSKLNLNEAGLGLVLLGMSVGELTSLSMSGGLIARYSSRKVTLIGGLGMAAGLFLLALAPSPLVLFITLLIFGGMLSSMDVAMNEQAVLVERNAGRALMSSFHAVYSIGALFGSLISAGMASLPRFPLALHFALMAVLFGAILLSVYPHMIPTGTETSGKKVPFQFPQRAVWALGAIAFCASMGEIAMADWSGVYLVRVLKTDAAFAALGYAAFSLTMTAGRMLGNAIARTRKPADIVRLGGIITVLGLLVLVFTSSPILAIVGFAAIGLGLSNIIPLVFSTAGNIPGIAPGAGIAGVANIGYLGALVGPMSIGFIANQSSLRISFVMVASLSVVLALLARSMVSTRANTDKPLPVEGD